MVCSEFIWFSPLKINGGGCAKLQELSGPVVSIAYKLSWEREYLDLKELARLRWIEHWKIERLADYFAASPTAIKERLRAIKKRPFDIGVPISSGVIRGR